jgi:hypothetical protein
MKFIGFRFFFSRQAVFTTSSLCVCVCVCIFYLAFLFFLQDRQFLRYASAYVCIAYALRQHTYALHTLCVSIRMFARLCIGQHNLEDVQHAATHTHTTHTHNTHTHTHTHPNWTSCSVCWRISYTSVSYMWAYVCLHLFAFGNTTSTTTRYPQHTSAYVSIRMLAYVSIRQHTSAYVCLHLATQTWQPQGIHNI